MTLNKQTLILFVVLTLGYPILYFALTSKSNDAQKLLNQDIQELRAEKLVLQEKFDSVLRVGRQTQTKIQTQHEKDITTIQHNVRSADDSTAKAVFEKYFGKARQLD
ncbi:hypothetical protein GOQ04_14735 [Emticicia sp. ODNR4P]|nr:hypothetical protein [Emticicia sp. ODNR4P]